MCPDDQAMWIYTQLIVIHKVLHIWCPAVLIYYMCWLIWLCFQLLMPAHSSMKHILHCLNPFHRLSPGAKHLCEPNHNGYVDYKDKKIIIGLSFSKGLNYPKPQAIRLKVIPLTLQCSFKQNILKVFFIYIFWSLLHQRGIAVPIWKQGLLASGHGLYMMDNTTAPPGGGRDVTLPWALYHLILLMHSMNCSI